NIDKLSEGRKSAWSTSMILSGIGAAIALVVSVNSAGVVSEVATVVIGALVLLFATSVYLYFDSGKTDFEDRRYELAADVMAMLAADVDAQAPLAVELDLRKVDHAQKVPKKRMVGAWHELHYIDPFLTIGGRFC